MLFSYLTSFLLGLFLFSTAVDTETDENLQVTFTNGRFQSSSSAMCAMLKKADLENNGYKKEVINKEVEEAGSGKSNFQTMYFYYKSVKCSYEATKEIEQELNTSLPGVIGKDMPVKVREEMKFRHLNNAGLCKMGLDVYFPEGLGCDMRRRKREDSDNRNEVKTRRPRGLRVRVGIEIRIRARIRYRRGWGRK